MLSVIVGNNNVGKTLLLKKLKDIVQNPAYLISEFPNKLPEKESNQESAFEVLDLPTNLIEEKKIYFKLFLRTENINRYKESITNKLENASNQDNQISRLDSNTYCDESKEQKKGFTKNLKSNDFFKFDKKKFESGNIELLLKPDLNQKELKALVKKYQRIKSSYEHSDISLFIKRQIIKKLIFTNLFQLLKQECFYKCEIDSLNEILKEKRFSYYIEIRETSNKLIGENDIFLVHRSKGFRRTLKEINATERLMLHFHMIVENRDLIKIHEKIDLNQIILFDQIDAKLDFKNSNDIIELIKYHFVKYLNIQCILTTNNHSTIATCNDDCLFRMSFDEQAKKLILETIKNESKEIVLNNKTKMKYPFFGKALEFQMDKKSRYDLNMELMFAKREIETLHENVSKLQQEKTDSCKVYEKCLEENKKIKEELRSLKENNLQFQMIQTNDNENTQKITPLQDESNLLDNSLSILDKPLEEISDRESKDFIEYLSQQVDGFEGRSRQMIKKMIDLLGPNLYTSELSFLNEVVQNFDDAQYLDTNNEACLKIIFSEEFILFLSNQTALKPREVKGICSLGESTKKKGLNIGNKGIGFKSVFLCTNNPVVVSRSKNFTWSFKFKVEAKNSEIDPFSYIKPCNVGIKEIKKLNEQIQLKENDQFTTLFYLPLDKPMRDMNKKDFVQKCVEKLNQNLLLFCQKLNKIEIVDNVNDTNFIYAKIPDRDEKLPKQVLLNFYKTDQNQTKLSRQFQYSIYEIEQEMPKSIAYEEKISFENLNQKITLAFPSLEICMDQTFPVYSFLPICDLGFKFIINCYWSLTTNRESINEHSSLNEFFLDKIVDLFVEKLMNEEALKNNLHSYIPKANMQMSLWWLTFIERIKFKIKETQKARLETQLGNKKSEIRLFNSALEKLINQSDDLKLINEKSNYLILSQNDYLVECLDFKIFSLKDLIEILAQVDDNVDLNAWKDERNEEWWTFFFETLANLNEKLLSVDFINKLRLLNIYLHVDPNAKRDSRLENENLAPMISDSGLALKYHSFWSSNVRLITYKSDFELKCLKEIFKLTVFDEVNFVIDLILNNHRNGNSREKGQLWKELEFIKQNFKLFESKFNSNEIKMGELLNLPIRNSDKCLFSKFTHLPNLLSLKLIQLSVLDEDKCVFIDFEEYSKTKSLEFQSILEWEEFFLNIGCQLPKLDSNVPQNVQLFDFSIYQTKEMINYALRILDLISNNREFIDFFKCLPVRAKLNKLNEIEIVEIPMNKVYGKRNETKPYIELNNEYQEELAKKLDIKFEFNDDHNEDLSEYIDGDNNTITIKNRIVPNDTNSFVNKSQLHEIKFKCFDFESNVKLNFCDFHHSDVSNKYQEEDKRIEIGEKAELYFWQFLLSKYPNDADKFKWVSLCANKYLNTIKGDDKLGYDFKLEDSKGVFGTIDKTYLIEVKGIGYSWSDNIKFHLSENEKKTKESAREEDYLVVLIENVLNSDKTKIASVINWSRNDIIQLESITYKALVVKDRGNIENNENNNRSLRVHTTSTQFSNARTPNRQNTYYTNQRSRASNKPFSPDDDNWRRKPN